MYSDILFDLDGTLVNTEKGIFQSIAYAAEKMQLPSLPKKTLRKFLGPPLHDSFERYFSLSPEQALLAVDTYREHYRAKGVMECELYPGMKALLHRLKEEGFSLYVATSKPTVFAERVLKAFHVAEYFSLIQGSELNDPHSTSKALIIEKVIQKAQLSKENCLLVGDTRFDGEGAAQAGIPFLPVLYGFGEWEEMQALPHIGIAKSVESIAELLSGKVD